MQGVRGKGMFNRVLSFVYAVVWAFLLLISFVALMKGAVLWGIVGIIIFGWLLGSNIWGIFARENIE
jgi:hypothetical protein